MNFDVFPEPFFQRRFSRPMPTRIRYDTIHGHGSRRNHIQRFRRRGVSFAQLNTGRPSPVAA